MLRRAAVIGLFLDDRRLEGFSTSSPDARRRLSPSRCSATPPARRAAPGGDVAQSPWARHGRREGGRRPPARERRGGRQEPAPPLRGRGHDAQPPADERALAGRPGRLAAPGVRGSCSARDDRGDPVERARADARPRPGRRLGPDLLADGDRSGGARRRGCCAGDGPSVGRGAPGSAPRRRDREHVDVGDALGSSPVAVARCWPSDGRGARRQRWCGRDLPCEPPSRGPERSRRSTAAPAVPALVAARRSSPAARATTTAPPTGARPVSRVAAADGSFHSVRARVLGG